MTEEENKLKNLKENYSKIQEKYNFPSFEELNQDFLIERIAEVQTDYLVREIRRFMADKFSNYMRFIESILNPVNAPMFIFSVVKAMTNEDKQSLTNAYKKLAKIEVNLIEIDVKFSEEKEAEFIKKSNTIWQEIKKDVLDFVNSVQKNWDNKIEPNGKGYFG